MWNLLVGETIISGWFRLFLLVAVISLIIGLIRTAGTKSQNKRTVAMLEDELQSVEAQLNSTPDDAALTARRAEIVRTLEFQYPGTTKGKYDNYQ